MGEYECVNCNEIFHKDEPPYGEHNLCELCRKEMTDD
jgi:DNA-directed RNA polymerase subunit RPC12/RpoP